MQILKIYNRSKETTVKLVCVCVCVKEKNYLGQISSVGAPSRAVALLQIHIYLYIHLGKNKAVARTLR